ncbi:MAG: alpha/beta fold hydrolase [Solirubrobacterales bacterium]|nr:alpha/beta fold hydrolase [Solirubrobacterales bacterium]
MRHLVAAAAATLLLAVPAAAQETNTTVTGWTKAPGPRSWDRLEVTKTGPSSAKTVLVLVPGTAGGRGDFTLVARDLVKEVQGLQVWSVDRRSQRLEDTSVFEQAIKGQASLQQMFDYYLGWIGNSNIQPHFQAPDPQKHLFMGRWGLQVQLEDVRRVVKAASRGGRRVVLGGHSLGASVAVAYAAWDFAGTPGYKDLDGLVLIDGGLRGSFNGADLKEAKRLKPQVERQPWLDLLGIGLPWTSGVFAEAGAILTLKDPTGPSVAQAFNLLPPQFKPPVPATNRGLFGYAFDESSSPKALSLIHVRAGTLAAEGDPRDWADGEVTPVQRLAETFGGEPANAVEWYFPRRLTLDVDAASALSMTPAARYLKLRLRHARKARLPLYALQTSLTGGRVLKGAKSFARLAGIKRPTLVDASSEQSHLDPLTAAPERNRFLTTVAPFLRNLP